MTTKTDRDLWSEPQMASGIFAYSMLMNGARDDFVDGLKGFALAWFATYEDETDLPPAFFKLIEMAQDLWVEDLDLPGQGDDDEDDS